ncbi:aspartate dehydrogenase [Palleronia marisminoris]|uniref:L-aspartate dehydrogenase n=1 Tax=Palleronia marisminoris TaxID=315423 RepID=A0A1Y5STY2_9RHOB|nr:aspartate dehydrogenase [Palleronia marisminoris]SFG92994.1 aspartate dehydrogenase [Palleronia marisminoris]SLN45007.1 L-aspartate dehydrogenase [Palleronia marisminoris]
MRLGLIGYGNIAASLLDLLGPDLVQEVVVLVRRPLDDPPEGCIVVTEARALIDAAPDLVVECAGHGAVAAHGETILAAGINLVVASVGALADARLYVRLQTAAQHGGARLLIPSGAIGGLDLLEALALSGEVQIAYVGIKPPAAWRGTPAEDAGDLSALTCPLTVYTGGAREAARLFPRNSNVVAALALAGPGFEAVSVRLIADPAAVGNVHRYHVRSPDCRATVEIEGQPSSGNGRTSRTTVYSLLREIRRAANSRHQHKHTA